MFFKDEDLISYDLLKNGKSIKDINKQALLVLDFMKLYIAKCYKRDVYINYKENRNQGWCSKGHAVNSHHYTGNAFDLNFVDDSKEIWDLIKYDIVNNLNEIILDDYEKLLNCSVFDLKEALQNTYWEGDITWGHFQIIPPKSGNRIFKA